jgi:hypothetical protein
VSEVRISKYRDTTVFRLNLRGGAGPVDPDLPEDAKPGVQYRRLFRGDPDRPGNFEMVVLRSPRDDASIHFPRHRHDFDQVRLTLAGNPAWAPKREVPPGSVVYTAAGTFYGPYDRFADEEQLHIQFEGANHARFLDYDTLADARRRMSRDGRFERGIYITADDEGNETKTDAHQAVMEFLTGRPMTYPRSRYTDSIQIDPGLFGWDEAGPGARTKQLGSFTECLTTLWTVQVDAGAEYAFPASAQTRLVFVQDGTGVAEGEEIGPWDGLLLGPGETGVVTGGSTLTLFVLTLPKTGDQTTQEADAA